MKRYTGFFEKIISIENLRVAHRMAQQDKKFYKDVKMVNSNEDYYLSQLHELLAKKEYKIVPSDYTVSNIFDKGKQRELRKLHYYPHRIVQWAIMLQIQPIFEKVFCDHSCASIPQKGGHYAYKLLTRYLKDRENSQYCLKLDISKFYQNINHDILKNQLRRVFKDADLLELVDNIIDSTPGKVGIPIGSYLSQFLANFYLTPFDHWVKEELRVKKAIRYMDDIVILDGSKKTLAEILKKLEVYFRDTLNLTIKGNFQIFPVDVRGIDFIGYRFFHDYILLRKSTCKRLKKLFTKLLSKHRLHQLLSFSEFAAANSYIGWLKWCNSYNLNKKYSFPLVSALTRCYKYAIHQNTEKSKREKLLTKYRKKLIRSLS